MKVLIVSKTKMGKTKVCVGGIVFPNLQSVRLLEKDGAYQPLNSKFEIGQIWDLEFEQAAKFIAPHVEDVHVLKKTNLNKTYSDFSNLVKRIGLKANVWKGDVRNLFEGKLRWTHKRNGYISNIAVPSVSTGFWISDKDLSFDQNHYYYRNDGPIRLKYGLSYVGFQKSSDIIPAGTIIRVSLAKWWKPEDVDMELRCYLQLSGWY